MEEQMSVDRPYIYFYMSTSRVYGHAECCMQ